MIIIYAGEIRHLVDMAVAFDQKKADVADLMKVRDAALNFSEQTLARFLFNSKARVREEESEKIYEQLKIRLGRRIGVIKSFDEVIKMNDSAMFMTLLKSLEDVSFDIFGIGLAYREKQNSFPKLSPIPFFDNFLKLAVAVNNGEEQSSSIAERIPLAVGHLKVAENDYARFSKFYNEETGLIDKFKDALDKMKPAIGAFQVFTETIRNKDLRDGIRLLSGASSNLYNVFSEIDETRSKKALSPLLPVDCFLRGLKLVKAGKITGDDYKSTISDIEEYIEEFQRQIEEFRRDFVVKVSVFNEFSEKFLEKKETLEKLILKIKETDPGSFQIDQAAGEIAAEFKEINDMREKFAKQALGRKDMSSVPEIAELQEAVVGVYKGVVTLTTLEEIILKTIARFHSLLDRVSKLPDDDTLTPLRKNISGTLEGLAVTTSYFNDFDTGRLAAGLEIIEEFFDGLNRAEAVIAEYEKKGFAVDCPKCGHRNPPDLSFCSSCQTLLPARKKDSPGFEAVESEDGISVVKDTNFEMREIGVLENLIKSLDSGERVDGPIMEFIKEFTNKINLTMNKFRALTEPILEMNPDDNDLMNRVGSFYGSLERFRGAANEVSLFLVYKDPKYLRSGLDIMRMAQRNMMSALEIIQHAAQSMESAARSD